MQISVIGASKGVGKQVVLNALEKNHKVLGLARSSIESIKNKDFQQIQGDARDKDTVKKVITGTDAIIITLGQGKSFKHTTLTQDFAKILLEIHQETPLTIPIIFLSSFGTNESYQYSKKAPRIIFKTLLKKVYADKEVMEKLISNSSLNWCIVRPGMLTDGPLTKKYRIENTLYKGINIQRISRKDVADFMVNEAVSPKNAHQFVSLTG